VKGYVDYVDGDTILIKSTSVDSAEGGITSTFGAS
jgi:hypothetical protein